MNIRRTQPIPLNPIPNKSRDPGLREPVRWATINPGLTKFTAYSEGKLSMSEIVRASSLGRLLVSHCAAACSQCSRAAARSPRSRQTTPQATCVRAASSRDCPSSSRRRLSANWASAASHCGSPASLRPGARARPGPAPRLAGPDPRKRYPPSLA